MQSLVDLPLLDRQLNAVGDAIADEHEGCLDMGRDANAEQGGEFEVLCTERCELLSGAEELLSEIAKQLREGGRAVLVVELPSA